MRATQDSAAPDTSEDQRGQVRGQIHYASTMASCVAAAATVALDNMAPLGPPKGARGLRGIEAESQDGFGLVSAVQLMLEPLAKAAWAVGEEELAQRLETAIALADAMGSLLSDDMDGNSEKVSYLARPLYRMINEVAEAARQGQAAPEEAAVA